VPELPEAEIEEGKAMTVTITVKKTFEAYDSEIEAIKGKSKGERDEFFIDGAREDPPGFFDGAEWKVTVRRGKCNT
jgi:hypothetical protein